MNTGPLNCHALNSAPADVTVRAAVQGTAYALANVLTRVMRRDVLTLTGVAQASPKGLRLVRDPLSGLAQAKAQPLGLRLVRSVVSGQAQAQATIWTGFIRIRVMQEVQALAVVTARVLRREALAAPAQATASPNGKRLARAPVESQPQALGTVTATVAVRRYLSEVMLATARALGVASLRAWVRNPVAGANTAQGVARVSAALRSPTTSTAQAVGFVGGSVVVVRPFDEVARPENTFVVTFEDNVFFVR